MVLPIGGGEDTKPENMEALYAYIRLWGTEEEDNTPFPYWKGVDEYHELVERTSLSANFAAVFLEAESLLNYHVEHKVILNDITQYKNKVLGDESNKTIKFHRLERSMEESVFTFQSVIEAEQ